MAVLAHIIEHSIAKSSHMVTLRANHSGGLKKYVRSKNYVELEHTHRSKKIATCHKNKFESYDFCFEFVIR